MPLDGISIKWSTLIIKLLGRVHWWLARSFYLVCGLLVSTRLLSLAATCTNFNKFVTFPCLFFSQGRGTLLCNYFYCLLFLLSMYFYSQGQITFLGNISTKFFYQVQSLIFQQSRKLFWTAFFTKFYCSFLGMGVDGVRVTGSHTLKRILLLLRNLKCRK